MATGDPVIRLPPGFATVTQILDGDCDERRPVNFAGLVTQLLPPIKTAGTDWKYQLQLYDESVQWDSGLSMRYNVFLPLEHMPSAELGDVLVVLHAKIQRYRGGSPSLIHNRASKLYVFDASKLSNPRREPLEALRLQGPSANDRPAPDHLKLVSQLYHQVNKERLPSLEEFDSRKITSTHVKQKFNTLANVTEGLFCDLIVNIVREPYDNGQAVTLWVSDYTENPQFYNFPCNQIDSAAAGQLQNYPQAVDDITPQEDQWRGPFGQRCFQITCWEPHATVIRNQSLGLNNWVELKNVQIKTGRNGANLEGFLREDLNAWNTEVKIRQLVLVANTELNVHLKEAVRRKRDYETQKKAEMKSLQKVVADAAIAGQKRRAHENVESASGNKPSNSRKRRKEKRRLQQEQLIAAELGNQVTESSDATTVLLNPNITFENIGKPPSSVGQMMRALYFNHNVAGYGKVELRLPFANLCYRANLRVVDFSPSSLKDFTRRKSKRSAEYDILSDNEDDPSSDSDSSMSTTAADDMDSNLGDAWEFQFALKLVDAEANEGQDAQAIWVEVDNGAAQCLTNLDASDLHRDAEGLEKLRQCLFQLWGDLEEVKARQNAKTAVAARRIRDQAPPDSSIQEPAEEESAVRQQARNRPFGCCIKQFGVKEAEDDPAKCDAGPSKKWKRCFMLFGTKIKGCT